MKNPDPRFGADQQPPTPFEVELLSASTDVDDIWVTVGQLIGPESLFLLFKELGGLIVSVPTRQSFVKRLYLPQRDAEILARVQAGERLCDIARDYNTSWQTVHKAAKRALRTGRRAG